MRVEKNSRVWSLLRYLSGSAVLVSDYGFEEVLSRIELDDRQQQILVDATPVVEEFLKQYMQVERQIKQEQAALELYAKAKPGYVYLFHLFDDVYKIGRSTNPENRLKAVANEMKKYAEHAASIGNPIAYSEAALVHSVSTPDSASCEDWFHEMFEDTRIDEYSLPDYPIWAVNLTTEIFRLTPELIARFKSFEYWEPEWWQMAVRLSSTRD